MSNDKARKRGRPREYEGGTKKLSVTIPTRLLKEFKETLAKHGSGNLSLGMQDAIRYWMTIEGDRKGGEQDFSIFVHLKPDEVKLLKKIASADGSTASEISTSILRAFLADHSTAVNK